MSGSTGNSNAILHELVNLIETFVLEVAHSFMGSSADILFGLDEQDPEELDGAREGGTRP